MEAVQQVADLDRDTEPSEDAMIDSVVIQRLIAEVRADDDVLVPRNYNRTHNRHNR